MEFVPSLPIVLQFAAASLVLAITPGPDMTLFVGRALSEGRAAGFACMLGAFTGILIHTTLVAVGLSALIVASPEAFTLLKIGGAGYLLWLAVHTIRHGSAFAPRRQAGPRSSFLRNWAKGLGVNLLNPKIILFFMTFLPQFVSASDPHAPGKLMFLGLFFILVSLPVTSPMVLAAHGFAALMRKSPAVTRMTDWLFAGVFSAFAVKILLAQSK
jgi:threonine/homoserine/homoserine lactone efflux protein